MRDLVEEHVRPVLRGAVDRLVGDPQGRLLAAITGVYGVLVLGMALLLLGVFPIPGRQQTGALPVVSGATPSGQVLELARQLRFEDVEGEHAASLGDLNNIEPATRAWLDAQVCKAPLEDARQRAARAWRVNQNPDLCGPLQSALARAPLNVAFGPVAGVSLTLALLLLLLAPVVIVFQWLPAVRRAYHSLYTSRHRIDRLGGA
jgi:hypothetical protein